MNYLYSPVIDTFRRFPPQVAAHRVMCITEMFVHVECNIAGIWTPESDIVLRKRPRKATVKVLSRQMLESRGYARDGLCSTYYTTPDAVQALIDNEPSFRMLAGLITKRRGK